MKHVKLIRHGESAANAGEPTRDHASTPLTAKGMEQDHMVVHSHTSPPDLIVASPFCAPNHLGEAALGVCQAATSPGRPIPIRDDGTAHTSA
ncbi:phosphoglycerate mutase family protein [Pseudomonas putida]|uniref:phosphoglycerate mutase family protein n=1 Tax=Pseudomonas putida TaxID=303 RepID=UPI0039062ECD